MPSSKSSNSPSRRLVLQTLAALPVISMPLVASVRTAVAQTPIATGAGFSFAAVGDTRPMMYLPLKEGQPDLNKFFVEMFGLVMPEKVAEAVVARDVKMIFDPVTKELIKVIMPFASKTEVMTLTVEKLRSTFPRQRLWRNKEVLEKPLGEIVLSGSIP